MVDSFTVALADLPEYGLRTRSSTACAVHRFADDGAIPACAPEGNGGAMYTNPGDYKRVRLSLAAESRRFSLCSHGHCFGRLRIARPTDSAPERPTESVDRQVV